MMSRIIYSIYGLGCQKATINEASSAQAACQHVQPLLGKSYATKIIV